MNKHFKKSMVDYIKFFGVNYSKVITNNYLNNIESYNNTGYVFFNDEHLKEILNKFNVVDTPQNTDYSTINIAKKSGKIRAVNIPYYGLKKFQQFINKDILSQCETSTYCHAYVKNKSILTNASMHSNKKLVICIDIKDFFNSFKIGQVVNVFTNLGYNYEISSRLASLCTCNGSLPIGAPTSPSLCNIIFKDYDIEIAKLASKYDLIYTRYADDLTFSTDNDDINTSDFIENISKLLKLWSFELNEKKTKIYPCKGKQEVTGLIVNDGVKVKSKIKKEVQKDLYYSIKYGISTHLNNKYSNYCSFNDKTKNYIESKFLMRLYGKINFIKMIEPLNGSKLESDFIYLLNLTFSDNNDSLYHSRYKKLFA